MPTADFLLQRLSLNAETGVLTWKERTLDMFPKPWIGVMWNKRFAGKEAGCKNSSGYVGVGIGHEIYPAHRLVWLMIGNKLSDDREIDHRDGNGQNNAPSNLREVDHSGNSYNASAKGGRLRLKGVCEVTDSRNFQVRIQANGKQLYLGTFPTKGLAAVAYAKAALRYHGEFACLRPSRNTKYLAHPDFH